MSKKGNKKRKKSRRARKHLKGDQVSGGKRVIQHVGGSYIEGDVTASGGGDLVMGDQSVVDASQHQTTTLFQPIYVAIAGRPDTAEPERAAIDAVVKEIEAEAKKGEAADERFLDVRLRNLKKMAPDIWEVVLATLANPVAGLGAVVSKIAKRSLPCSAT